MWQRIKNIFGNMSIRLRLFLCYMGAIVLAVLMSYAILIDITVDEMEAETTEIFSQMVSQINIRLDDYITQIDKIPLGLYSDSSIPLYLRSKKKYFNQKEYSKELQNNAYNYMQRMMQINHDIWSISVVTDDDTTITISKNGYERTTIPFSQNEQFDELRTSMGDLVVLPLYDTSYYFTNSVSVFAIGRRYMDTSRDEYAGMLNYTGYIYIECSESIIENMCRDVSIGNSGHIFVMDGDRELILSTNANEVLDIQLAEKLTKTGTGQKIEIDGEKYVLVSSKSDITGWSVVGVIPYHEMYQKSFYVQRVYFGLMIVCLMIIFIASVVVSRSIVNPITNLRNAMRKFEAGRMDISVDYLSKNEIGDLTRHFNRLTRKVSQLLASVQKAEAQKREAELKMLRSQINPHFIYNTLDVIRMMALLDDNEKIASALEKLANLFRYNIKQRADIVEIRYEVEHIKNYISLQKLRFGEQFDIKYDIDDAVLSYKTLKFTLQPLVENAIIHGFQNIRCDGLLEVSIKKEEERIIFSVRDNGMGIDSSDLEELMEELKKTNDEVSNIGMKNIYDRLVLYFGLEGTLNIESDGEGAGTCVWFSIPAFENESNALIKVMEYMK